MKYSSYTRRDFLRLTGTTVAGASLFGSLRKGYAANEVVRRWLVQGLTLAAVK